VAKGIAGVDSPPLPEGIAKIFGTVCGGKAAPRSISSPIDFVPFEDSEEEIQFVDFYERW
jgi:hypothetical protein